MSSATDELLSTAEIAIISTANITVVNLNPFEDDLLIFIPARCVLIYYLYQLTA